MSFTLLKKSQDNTAQLQLESKNPPAIQVDFYYQQTAEITLTGRGISVPDTLQCHTWSLRGQDQTL